MHIINGKSTLQNMSISTPDNPLSDELPNITSVNIKNNQLIMVDYKAYVMINKDAIALLSTMITESDMGRLLEMADMIATEFNILFTKDDKIHNRDSLAIDLILFFGETRGATNFGEEIIQFKLDVLFDNSYYNDAIGSRRFVNVKMSDSFKEQIMKVHK